MKTYTLQDQTHAFVEASPQKFYLNGEWQASEKAIDVIDPATATVITQVSLAQPDDVANAVGSAESAFKAWSKTDPSERAGLLRKLAELIRRDLPILAELESIDVGKPIWRSRGL